MILAAAVLFAPQVIKAEDKKPVETVAIQDQDTGDFEGDISEAAGKMRETLLMTRRDKFFLKLDKIIDNGDMKKAEELLEKQLQNVPAYKGVGAYIVAKSKIAYAKGDYQTAYAEADKFIGEMEKVFAPQKPYEAVLKDKNDRDTVCYAYILRYQALAQMRRYEEALADLDRAQRQVESPELLSAKTATLIALKRYAEAAAAAEKAYALDKNIFASNPYRDNFCWLFSEHGYNVKSCAYFAALAKEQEEKEKTAR